MLRKPNSLQNLLLSLALVCALLPIIYGHKKVVSFTGRVTPIEQPLIDKNYIKTKEMDPITWTVEILKCVGCDKYGPKRPSTITQNGAFQILLLRGDEKIIEKLVVKIKSGEEVPSRMSENEAGERHRKFTWILRNLDLNKVHHFNFGHFRPINKQSNLYLSVEFVKALPMKTNGPNEKEGLNLFKYEIQVKRERFGIKKWMHGFDGEEIANRELTDEEIGEGHKFKVELKKEKKHKSGLKKLKFWEAKELTERLLAPRAMEIVITKVPICHICVKDKKIAESKREEPIFKLAGCMCYAHKSCIEKHIANNPPPHHDSNKGGTAAAAAGEGEAGPSEPPPPHKYSCPICKKEMIMMDQRAKKSPKEKDVPIYHGKITKEQFFHANLKMPILQKDNEPDYTYKFNYQEPGCENSHNAVDQTEEKATSKLIDELIAALWKLWGQKAPTPPPPSPPPQSAAKEETSTAHLANVKFPILISELFKIASESENDEQKILKIENYYEDWMEENEREVNLSVGELAQRIGAAHNFKFKEWQQKLTEENDGKEIVSDEEREMARKMRPQIYKMFALCWLRQQRKSDQNLIDAIEFHFKNEEDGKKWLLEGLAKKDENAFYEFAKEYSKIGAKEKRMKALENWAKFMGMEDLFDQIAMANNEELGLIMSQGQGEIAEEHKIINLPFELKELLKMAVIKRIIRRSTFKYKNSNEYRTKFHDSKCHTLGQKEFNEFEQIIGIACNAPNEREGYLQTNEAYREFFEKCGHLSPLDMKPN